MNGEPLVEKKESDVSGRYRAMADRLDHNATENFGGACLIVPPEGAGEPIEFLMLGSKNDAAHFWSTIQTRITIILEEHNAKKGLPFQRQR